MHENKFLSQQGCVRFELSIKLKVRSQNNPAQTHPGKNNLTEVYGPVQFLK